MGDVAVAGFLYGVARQGFLELVKVGFTRSKNPHKYCNNFNRTLCPVQILFLIPVSNARLAETMAHHFLKQHRVNQRNEMFDMTGAMDRLADCFAQVEAFDAATGQPRPDMPENKPAQKRKRKPSLPTHSAQQAPEVGVREMKRRVRAKIAEEDMQARIELQERMKIQSTEADLQAEFQKFVTRIQPDADKGYVRVHNLYQAFCTQLKTHTRSRMSAKVFERELLNVLDSNKFKLRHQVRVQKRNVTAGKVFLGYKLDI